MHHNIHEVKLFQPIAPHFLQGHMIMRSHKKYAYFRIYWLWATLQCAT